MQTLNQMEDSGIVPLILGIDAFVARLTLARKAQQTLDLKYFTWHGDQTGKLLAGAVVEAAERGVKVRMLLDDMGTAADDRRMLILDSHPNIEVRLFNPVGLRSARLLGFLLDFKRVNRRMHNKSFIVDNRVAIMGGRNIGDEYYGAASEMNFADFDVIAKGPVVSAVVDAFALYWNSAPAVPITQVSRKKVTDADLRLGMEELRAQRETMEQTPYAQAMRSNRLATATLDDLPFLMGKAMVVTDNPEKIANRPDDDSTHLLPQLRGVVAAMQKELIMLSPYFIPGKKGVKWFSDLAKRGVKARVISNSIGSNDVALVHTAYAKYRKPLIECGVEIYEMKSAPSKEDDKSESGSHSFSLTGSSKAGLHAKTFVFDRRWVFVGSLNLDPRSMNLNTEIGMIVDCPELAEQMIQHLETRLPETSWRVESTPKGLQWTTREKGQTITLDSEPGMTRGMRLKSWLISWLPIEGQL